ncbi:hypothetical protein IFR05_012185 [Cadophora sp. M221]|nr:hypothetical protein IFR05_012185 [Cadophora sp. M221]
MYLSWFVNSKRYNKLENECRVAFIGMMQEAGLSMVAMGHARRIVEDAFDNDPDVQFKVSTMEKIFNGEMNKFRNITRNQ